MAVGMKIIRLLETLDPSDRALLARDLHRTYAGAMTGAERMRRLRDVRASQPASQRDGPSDNGSRHGVTHTGDAHSPVVSYPSSTSSSEVQGPTRKELQEPAGFQAFWQAYPKRVGKGKARESWIKHRCELGKTLILMALQNQREYLMRDGGKYVPNPATWLNERRWEDDPPQPTRPGDERTARNVAGAVEWLRQQEAP